jgi:radical S-adenosyl methionine domain-containing protein 2
MNEAIEELAPARWKVSTSQHVFFYCSHTHPGAQVFQVLLLDGENTGSTTGSLRDARNLTITSEQFKAFLDRHARQGCLVPEDNESMRDTYLNLDERMRYAGLPSHSSFCHAYTFVDSSTAWTEGRCLDARSSTLAFKRH